MGSAISAPSLLRRRASGAEWENYGALGVTCPACLPVHHGHRYSPLAWRRPVRTFAPSSPAPQSSEGAALNADIEVGSVCAPIAYASSQGEWGWD